MTRFAARLAAVRSHRVQRAAADRRIHELEALLTHTAHLLEGVAPVFPEAVWVDRGSRMPSRQEVLRVALDVRARAQRRTA